MLLLPVLLSAALASQTVERIVVKVNGDIITQHELNERVRVSLAQQRGEPIGETAIREDPELRGAAAILTPGVLQAEIDELLVVQWARAHGLDASDDMVDRVIARLRQDNGIKTDEEFQALLVHEAIPPDDLRESVWRQIAVENVRDRESRATATEEEVQRYYQSHRDRYASGARVSFHEIHAALPDESGGHLSPADEAAHDRALVRFVAAEDRLRAGEDFEAVARDLSDDASAAAGGAIVAVDPATLAPALRDALARLTPGQVADPVFTGDGYVLARLDSTTPPRPATYQAWRADARRDLLDEKRATGFTRRLARLRAEAMLDWKDKALETACEALMRR